MKFLKSNEGPRAFVHKKGMDIQGKNSLEFLDFMVVVHYITSS
jgi:hypothetical protein